jgi:hypothetical protein
MMMKKNSFRACLDIYRCYAQELYAVVLVGKNETSMGECGVNVLHDGNCTVPSDDVFFA